jgi:hypothetical protein
MKKSMVEIGNIYLVRVSGNLVPVNVVEEVEHHKSKRNPYSGEISWGSRTHWLGKNLKTGRIIEIRSAAKLRQPLSEAQIKIYLE